MSKSNPVAGRSRRDLPYPSRVGSSGRCDRLTFGFETGAFSGTGDRTNSEANSPTSFGSLKGLAMRRGKSDKAAVGRYDRKRYPPQCNPVRPPRYLPKQFCPLESDAQRMPLQHFGFGRTADALPDVFDAEAKALETTRSGNVRVRCASSPTFTSFLFPQAPSRTSRAGFFYPQSIPFRDMV